MKNSFENPNNFQESLQTVREKLIAEVLELATNPDDNRGVTPAMYDALVRGEKISWNIALWGMTARIGQDARINPHQLESIRREIFLD